MYFHTVCALSYSTWFRPLGRSDFLSNARHVNKHPKQVHHKRCGPSRPQFFHHSHFLTVGSTPITDPTATTTSTSFPGPFSQINKWSRSLVFLTTLNPHAQQCSSTNTNTNFTSFETSVDGDSAHISDPTSSDDIVLLLFRGSRVLCFTGHEEEE